MAFLISCPACDGDVSTEARSCPHCGHPLKVTLWKIIEQFAFWGFWIALSVIILGIFMS